MVFPLPLAWYMLRNQEGYRYSDEHLKKNEVDVLKTLLWASQFGFHSLEVTDNYIEREKFLQLLLVKETTELFRRYNQKSPGFAFHRFNLLE